MPPPKGKGIALLLGAPEGEEGRPGHGPIDREGLQVALKDFFDAASSGNWEEATSAFVDALALADVDEDMD